MDGLLCLHGFTGRGSVWRPALAACAWPGPAPAAWCPDLLGHGPRPPGARVADFAGEVDRLAAGLGRRGIDRALVVGYSLGARLGLGLLVRHGARVAGAVLIGARAGLVDDQERRARRTADRELAADLRRDGVAAFVDRWQAQPLFASQRRLDARRRAAHRRRRLSHTADGLARALEVLGLGAMPDLAPALTAVGVPVRLMAGALDRAFAAAAEGLTRSLPQAMLDVVPDAGHDLVLERPRTVAAAIEEEWRRCLT